MYRDVQRYLNAKSFCHYANDAYSLYEVLHVIGLSQDYFLSSKDRKWGNERGRDIQRKRIEEEDRSVERRGSLLEHGKQEPIRLLSSRFASERIYIPYFRRIAERPKERPKRSKEKEGERQGYPRVRKEERDTQRTRSTAFLFPKRIYFLFAR